MTDVQNTVEKPKRGRKPKVTTTVSVPEPFVTEKTSDVTITVVPKKKGRKAKIAVTDDIVFAAIKDENTPKTIDEQLGNISTINISALYTQTLS